MRSWSVFLRLLEELEACPSMSLSADVDPDELT